jgi:CheY-like chemotaxis protein
MTSLLVVEGNPEVRRMICVLVEGLVGPIYECEDPARVAELYRQTPLDWILIDIRLKQRNGLLATRRIKQQFPEAENILITDYDDQALRKADLESGADH